MTSLDRVGGGQLGVAEMRVVRWVLVLAALVGLAAGLSGGRAWAAGTLHLSATTGLVQKQIITVTGRGFAPGAFGYVLECNRTPREPTVFVGPPFRVTLPIGCSAPSLKHLVSTNRAGVLSTTFQIRLSKQIGPPCGRSNVLGSCGRTDSAGQHAKRDAQNYPCPPTAAQRRAGVRCALVFYDSAHDVALTPISF